jgi:cell wall assembly regulator SMI1
MAVDLARTWQRIEVALEKAAPEVSRALAGPADVKHLRKLERKLGAKLPRDLRASLACHDGMHGTLVRLFNDERLLSVSQMQQRWDAHLARMDAPEWAEPCPLTRDRKIKNDRFWSPSWLPLTESGQDGFVVDLDPAPRGTVGQVFYFHASASRPRGVVASSVAGFLGKIATLLSRKRFSVEDGGVWLSLDPN